MILRHTRPVSCLLLLISILAAQTSLAATRHPEKRPARQPVANRAERNRVAARRRAEAARLAALARQKAAEEAMRDRVQQLIAKDDPTGENPEIRRLAVNALGNHAGTVVVMNPKTGRIYSIVNQQWALREGFKPCSIIKLITGLAGLNEGVIDRQDTKPVSDSNQASLTSALAHSKNGYFQTVGGQVGFSKMISYARQLGLGEKTGINVRNESAGRVPQSKSGFAVNHMSSHGDDFKVTALQLAMLVSTISNGGKLLRPFVPRPSQLSSTSANVRRTVDINSDAFKSMLPGMIGSVRYGSGRRAFNPDETIAGKTGTCIEQGSWIGLFASYGPVNDPEFAVVVIARGTDGRNHFPAAVAGKIYRDLISQFSARHRSSPAGNRAATTVQTESSISDTNTGSNADDADGSAEDGDKGTGDQTRQAAMRILGAQRPRFSSRVKPTIMPITNPTGRSANTNQANVRPRN